MTIGILIFSDVCLYREGLERALRADGRLDVVGTATTWNEILDKAGTLKPDIVLLDLLMEDQCAFIRRIVAVVPAARVVVVTAPEAAAEMVALVEAGVAGYVTRSSSLEQLIQSMEAVARGGGKLPCSLRIAGGLLQRLRSLAAEQSGTATLPRLTPRESQILDLVEKGWPNKEIARALNIEVATVKNHVHSILQKLHVHHRGAAAALWRRGGVCNRQVPVIQ